MPRAKSLVPSVTMPIDESGMSEPVGVPRGRSMQRKHSTKEERREDEARYSSQLNRFDRCDAIWGSQCEAVLTDIVAIYTEMKRDSSKRNEMSVDAQSTQDLQGSFELVKWEGLLLYLQFISCFQVY